MRADAGDGQGDGDGPVPTPYPTPAVAKKKGNTLGRKWWNSSAQPTGVSAYREKREHVTRTTHNALACGFGNVSSLDTSPIKDQDLQRLMERPSCGTKVCEDISLRSPEVITFLDKAAKLFSNISVDGACHANALTGGKLSIFHCRMHSAPSAGTRAWRIVVVWPSLLHVKH